MGRASIAIQCGSDELSQALCCLKSRFRLQKKKKQKNNHQRWKVGISCFLCLFSATWQLCPASALLLRMAWWLPSLHTDPAWKEGCGGKRGEGGRERVYCAWIASTFPSNGCDNAFNPSLSLPVLYTSLPVFTWTWTTGSDAGVKLRFFFFFFLVYSLWL